MLLLDWIGRSLNTAAKKNSSQLCLVKLPVKLLVLTVGSRVTASVECWCLNNSFTVTNLQMLADIELARSQELLLDSKDLPVLVKSFVLIMILYVFSASLSISFAAY